MKRAAAAALAVCLACAGALVATQRADLRFPHLQHERLFPVCEGCHAGVVSGAATELYPTADDCARCHDGAREPRLAWQAPRPRASNLRFSHPEHAALLGAAGTVARCQACHSAADAASRMDVGPARPGLCLACHAHAVDSHLAAAAECGVCHVPLTAASAIGADRIARFPRPDTHESAGFASAHAVDDGGGGRSCAICHARETCERCHANADRLAQVAALGRDPRVAALEAGRRPSYPVPAQHLTREWERLHGGAAQAAAATCDNCHTRPTCAGCHLEPGAAPARAIAALPSAPAAAPARAGTAAGARVHPAEFEMRHAGAAAAGSPQCAACHAQTFCSGCHAGTDSRAFHPANFTERHATDVFAAGSSCQACHDTETFCRACHAGAGVASRGRMNAAFHTGQPLWVLAHGQAARTGMDACVACHRQADCVQCHSAAGGWGVNPHGPTFPANRMAARNPATCRTCHPHDPLARE